MKAEQINDADAIFNSHIGALEYHRNDLKYIFRSGWMCAIQHYAPPKREPSAPGSWRNAIGILSIGDKPAVTQDQIREAFEEWLDDNYMSNYRNSDGDYTSDDVAPCWISWQAAAAHYAPKSEPDDATLDSGGHAMTTFTATYDNHGELEIKSDGNVLSSDYVIVMSQQAREFVAQINALPALIAFVGNRLERETHPEHEDAYEEMEAHHE